MSMRMILAAGALLACGGGAAAQQCLPAQNGAVYDLKPVDPVTLGALQAVDLASGYHLAVSVNGAPNAGVLIDTGSNLLVLPYFKFGNLPADAARIPGAPGVVSGLVPYAYGSSGNSYRGYLVEASVALNQGVAGGAAPAAPVARNVIAYAATEACKPEAGGQTVCAPVLPGTPQARIGMMGVGFQAMASTLVMNDGQTPARTNVFAQIPGIETIGYAFTPTGVVVGLNAQVAPDVAWAPLQTDPYSGSAVPTGCFAVTLPTAGREPGQGPQHGPFCGTMMLDTGLPDMYAWQSVDPAACPGSATGDKTAGFAGTPYPPKTQIALMSPPANPVMNYSFTVPDAQTAPAAGTPRATYCAPTKAPPHSNISRMPLARYTYIRNQTCGTFGFLPN